MIYDFSMICKRWFLNLIDYRVIIMDVNKIKNYGVIVDVLSVIHKCPAIIGVCVYLCTNLRRNCFEQEL